MDHPLWVLSEILFQKSGKTPASRAVKRPCASPHQTGSTSPPQRALIEWEVMANTSPGLLFGFIL